MSGSLYITLRALFLVLFSVFLVSVVIFDGQDARVTILTSG